MNSMGSHLKHRYVQYLVKGRNRTETTAITFLQGLERLERHEGRSIEDINKAGGKEALRSFMLTDYAPRTKNLTLTAARSFHKWGADEGLWPLNGIMEVEGPKFYSEPKKPLSDEDARELLNIAGSPLQRRLIGFGLYLGTRVGESARIRAEDWSSDRIWIAPAKTHRSREIPVHPDLEKWKESILSEDHPQSGLLSTARAIRDIHGIEFTSHSLRRTFTRRLLDQRVREGVVGHLLGHAPQTTLQKSYAGAAWPECVEAIGLLCYP